MLNPATEIAGEAATSDPPFILAKSNPPPGVAGMGLTKHRRGAGFPVNNAFAAITLLLQGKGAQNETDLIKTGGDWAHLDLPTMSAFGWMFRFASVQPQAALSVCLRSSDFCRRLRASGGGL